MGLIRAKVYNDGSHLIAIPETKQPWKKRKRKLTKNKNEINSQIEKVFKENKILSKDEKTQIAIEKVNKIVKDEQKAKEIVEKNNERLKRNSVVRIIRMLRKANLQEWDYFCTFTYDDLKFSEEEFKKKLCNCFKHLTSRKGWKYIGVWEHSPTNNRLHFHGIFYTPQMVGRFEEIKDYSTKNHKMQNINQNAFFLKRFGRNDFKKLDKHLLTYALSYLLKYIRKSNERIVYSRNLPTYLLVDIDEEDFICPIGKEERKQILFDDFKCYDRDTGEYFGTMCKETKEKLKKIN